MKTVYRVIVRRKFMSKIFKNCLYARSKIVKLKLLNDFIIKKKDLS